MLVCFTDSLLAYNLPRRPRRADSPVADSEGSGMGDCPPDTLCSFPGDSDDGAVWGWWWGTGASRVTQWQRTCLPMQEMRVQSPGWEDTPGEGNGNPPQYSCLENPMDRGAWKATVHSITESDTTERLNNNNRGGGLGQVIALPRWKAWMSSHSASDWSCFVSGL